MIMQKNKIVYFDYWTVGVHNFLFFDKKLKSQGYDTKLIHLSSWRDIIVPPVQSISGLACYDISHYGGKSIFNVLKREMPRAVVMLNLSLVTDRTVVLSCKKLGIKIVYLAHGSLTRESFIDDSIEKYNVALKKGRLKKSIRQIRTTVWNYFNALIKYDWSFLFRSHGYAIILRTFIDPARYLIFPPPAFDLEPDLILLYSRKDYEYFLKRIKNRQTIKIIGNPDLDSFFRERPVLSENGNEFLSELNIDPEKPFVTYIDEGIVVDKIWDNQYRLAFVEQLAGACRETGHQLVIKLHPKSINTTENKPLYNIENLIVVEKSNFAKLIWHSSKIVCHYSTTLIYPILMGKPILVPRWDRSADVFSHNTVKEVTFVNSLEDLKKHLRSDFFNYDRKEFLEDYVPYNDGATDDRIVNYISELLR
jgi:hypothetical protein